MRSSEAGQSERWLSPPEHPLPLLHVPVGGVEPEFDDDEKAVREYAKDNPMEDLDDENEGLEKAEEGGDSADAQQAMQPDQSNQQHDMEDSEEMRKAKRQGGDVRLPISVRQRIAETEATKRGQQPGDDGQAKFVKFDPDTSVTEPSPKQQKTSLYSPVYAGEVAGSPSSFPTSRNVRRIVAEIDLYDEDELEGNFADDSLDWELCETQLDFKGEKMMISDEEKKRRGFFDEGAGPPQVTDDELAWLDQEATQAELERLRALDVVDDVGKDLVVEERMKLDTRLVRDWRFRENQWRLRARLVAREFRDGDASYTKHSALQHPLLR